MTVDASSPLHLKRRRLTTVDTMEAEAARAKFAAIKEKFGREVRVFETSQFSSSSPSQVFNDEESDEFYEFTAEDYYRILATKKTADNVLKTKKIREAEEADRRSSVTQMTKAVIRVRFPDNHTLEVVFHPIEKIQSLLDFVSKVVAQPEVPFYLYTAPPKKQIKDLSQDFFAAGFVPGAIVYFSYDTQKGDDTVASNSGPFLHEEIMALKGLDTIPGPAEPPQAAPEPVATASPTVSSPVPQERKPTEKKPVKPKWLKM